MSFKIGEVAIAVNAENTADRFMMNGEEVVIIKPLRRRRMGHRGVHMCYVVSHPGVASNDFYAKPSELRKKDQPQERQGWKHCAWQPNRLVTLGETDG